VSLISSGGQGIPWRRILRISREADSKALGALDGDGVTVTDSRTSPLAFCESCASGFVLDEERIRSCITKDSSAHLGWSLKKLLDQIYAFAVGRLQELRWHLLGGGQLD